MAKAIFRDSKIIKDAGEQKKSTNLTVLSYAVSQF